MRPVPTRARTRLLALISASALALPAAASAAERPEPAAATAKPQAKAAAMPDAAGAKRPAAEADPAESVQDVMFLDDDRPIFIRLKLDSGGKGFRGAWLDAIKALHTYLDRNGDGTLTKEEADRGSLPTMVRAATAGAAALPRADLDTNPKDGKVSLDELADVLRPALGPFRVQVGRLATERTDALFGHLDRDKDGKITGDELNAAVASLRRFDLDDDELIDPSELEPFSNPMAAMNEAMGVRGRGKVPPVPPVIELSPDDPSFRPVRLLLKKYDRGKGDDPGNDNRLGRGEFAIDSKDFAAADTDEDGALDTEELRRYLGHPRPDLEMTVRLSADGSKPAAIEIPGENSTSLPPRVKVHRLSPGDVEVAVGEINLEFHADGGENAATEAKSYYASQFQAADTNNDKYLEKSEVKDHNALGSLFDLMDRNGDGKLYLDEVNDFVDRQSEAARSQMVLSASDQGRAIFAIMDLNRDRRLGAREIRDALKRVSSWDANGDGRITADEIPHNFQMTVGRGRITAVGLANAVSHGPAEPAAAESDAAGPSWFRRMDRNRDGDISRREFLGPRKAFERLDADGDGLINAEEATKTKG